ncbi:uncharacterized protein LOC136079542 isoform X2 [Hydra vulgaris]|uniref:Uncharacterized protein LOC136079542 isoform X2 n=1 Tax=Hydra vulgaris TaxID=6087 RepID=A0ABM4BQN1_HYDVU
MSLISTLESILDLLILSSEVQQSLIESGFTLSSFLLATEDDLVLLGFRMAERRLLQAWIRSQINLSQTIPSKSKPSVSECTLPQCSSSSIGAYLALSSNNDCSATTATSSICFKNLRVDNILSKQKQKHVPICGQFLTEKLKAGGLITKAKMLFYTKVCGRYLMSNCIEKDRPTPTEKQDMSKSIVDCFPTLHDGTASGYNKSCQQ